MCASSEEVAQCKAPSVKRLSGANLAGDCTPTSTFTLLLGCGAQSCLDCLRISQSGLCAVIENETLVE